MGTLALGGIAAGTALATFAVDQATKAAVRRDVPAWSAPRSYAGGLVHVEHTENAGIALGLGAAVATWAPLVGVAAGAGVATVLLRTHSAPPAAVAAVGGFVLGGAAGNIADRVRHGTVTDFLRLPGTLPFNVADVGVCVGMPLLLGTALLRR